MIRISTEERKQLEKKFGLKMHVDIFPTYSKHRSYYLVEKSYNLNCLKRLHK